MPQTLETIKLARDKGQPTVEIIFGFAHVGNYRFFLFDAAGKNPVQLAHGNNIDDVIDTFGIGKDPSDLDQQILNHELVVQAAQAREGQIYSVTITVRQQGETCDGGVIVESGAFTDVKIVIGFRRFILA